MLGRLGFAWRVAADLPGVYRFGSRVLRGQEFGFSFNVADRCPVGCDCYWRAMERVPELEPEAMVAFFAEKRRQGYVLANLVGGEPYVHRKSGLLERLTEVMPASWLTTSGTTPLLHLRNTMHFISVDGGDAETHDRVRKRKGLHDRIVKHLEEARAQGPFPVCLHVTLNAQNYHQIGQLLHSWRERDLVDGVAFSTHTPIASAGDEWLLLSADEKRQIVAELHRQKREFGAFLLNTPVMIDRFLPEAQAAQRPETCPTARHVASFHADGSRISQCIFSDKGDCSGCGCVVTTALDSVIGATKLDRETVTMLRGILPPFTLNRRHQPQASLPPRSALSAA